MKITVRALSRPSWELDLNVNRSDTILEVKRKLCDYQSEIPLEKSTLLYREKILTDQNSLGDYNIRDLATIDLIAHRSTTSVPSTETMKPAPLHYPEKSKSIPVQSTQISKSAPLPYPEIPRLRRAHYSRISKLPPVQSTQTSKPAPLPYPEMPRLPPVQSTQTSKPTPVHYSEVSTSPLGLYPQSIPVQSTQTSKSTPVLLTATSLDDAACQSHEYWKTKAREGDFDEDLHIVDPHSHFHLMRKLKRDVIGLFQYLMSRLRTSNMNVSILDDAAFMAEIGLRPGTQDIVTRALTVWTGLEGTGTILELFSRFFGSYIMMLNALRSLNRMRRSWFCRNSISFFSELEGTDIIELKTIAVRLVIDFEKAMEKALIKIVENLDEDCFATILLDSMLPACRLLLKRIGLPVPRTGSTDMDVSLRLIRTTVLFLNHVLVSYVNSHGFEADSLGINVNEQLLDTGRADALTFRCSGVILACLDAFVDKQEVCVFRFHSNSTLDWHRKDPNTARRSVLAQIADIEDIWGPVYTVPSNAGLVKYYGVSKGVICRVRTKQECPIQGAIPCHYFTRSSFFRRKASRLFSGSQDLLLRKDDLLLIGTGLRENPNCTYHIGDFSRDWASETTVLGTQESVWKTDTRSVAVGFSKYLGVTVSGSQKLMPQTTRKQHILDKWTNVPSRCNPGILNQYLGVEISHCTGNARRVSLRHLMATGPITSIFERQMPGWTRTEWGKPLSQALCGQDDEAIFYVWKDFSCYRKEMAELFCGVFELLDSTGWKANDMFHAALIKLHDEEAAVQIPQRLNEWTVALRDTHLTGAYVIISEKCLNSDVHYYSISTCKVPQGFTMLQTRFVTEEPKKHLDRFCHYRLSPSDHDLELLACESSEITLFAIKEKSLFQLRGRLTFVELLTGSSDLENHCVHIRSSATSFHGRLTPKRADQPQPVVNTVRRLQSTTMTTRRSTPGTVNNPETTSNIQHRPNGTPVEPPRSRYIHNSHSSRNTSSSHRRSKGRINVQYQQNGTPVEPRYSHSTHSSHHRPVRHQTSWMSAFSRFIFGKGQTKPKPRLKTRMVRVAADSLDNRPSDQAGSSTRSSERHGSEADDGGPQRSDVYDQESWYHADGTTGIVNDMANYQFSEDSDGDRNEGGYKPESSLRASQRGNGVHHTYPQSAFHRGRHSSSRTRALPSIQGAFPSNDIGASSQSAGRPRQRR